MFLTMDCYLYCRKTPPERKSIKNTVFWVVTNYSGAQTEVSDRCTSSVSPPSSGLHHKDGGSRLLQNYDKFKPHHTTSQPRIYAFLPILAKKDLLISYGPMKWRRKKHTWRASPCNWANTFVRLYYGRTPIIYKTESFLWCWCCNIYLFIYFRLRHWATMRKVYSRWCHWDYSFA